MDFEEIWSEHKQYILMVAIGLIALLVFQGFKSAIYSDDTRRAINSTRSNLRFLKSEIQVKQSDIRSLQAERDELEERLQRIAKESELKVPAKYILPESNAKSAFTRVLQNTRDGVVDVASQQNIRIPYELGVPSITPSTREEMEQYLLGLSIVERVVTYAINLGVRRFETIEVKPEGGGGFLRETQVIFRLFTDGVVLSALLDRILDPADSLVLTRFQVSHPPRGTGIIATMGISIMKVDLDKPISEEGVR